jgi:hypothetical protein
MTSGCECGAAAECALVWHAALAAEQGDPGMAVWHNPLVCAFTLQHPSHFRRRFADGQFRFLELFIDQGVHAVNAMARRTAARNRGRNPDLTQSALDAYPPLPFTGFPPCLVLPFTICKSPMDASWGLGTRHTATGCAS